MVISGFALLASACGAVNLELTEQAIDADFEDTLSDETVNCAAEQVVADEALDDLVQSAWDYSGFSDVQLETYFNTIHDCGGGAEMSGLIEAAFDEGLGSLWEGRSILSRCRVVSLTALPNPVVLPPWLV